MCQSDRHRVIPWLDHLTYPISANLKFFVFFHSMFLIKSCLSSGYHNKYHRLSGFKKTQHWFLTVLETRKSKMPADSVPEESSIPGFQMSTFSLCALVTFPHCKSVERENELWFLPSLIRIQISSWETHPHDFI